MALGGLHLFQTQQQYCSLMVLSVVLCWFHFENSSISQCVKSLLELLQEGEAGGGR